MLEYAFSQERSDWLFAAVSKPTTVKRSPSRAAAAGLLLVLLLGSAAPETRAQSPNVHPTVSMHTSLGRIEIELYAEAAPMSVANFLRYVENRAYDGGQFYRTVRADNQAQNDVLIEVIQGGLSDLGKDRGLAPIEHESTQQTRLRHLDGTISLARDKPGTGSSEFFICIGAQPELDFKGRRNPDGEGFAAFGQVIHGMDVVRAIQASPTHAAMPGQLEYTSGQMLVSPVRISTVVVVLPDE